jgi:hypothetical protein
MRARSDRYGVWELVACNPKRPLTTSNTLLDLAF